MREDVCCFTGHRVIHADKKQRIHDNLQQCVYDMIQKGVIFFAAGGALGFDTMAALVVLEWKKVYPQIRLVLVLPCEDQMRGWSKEDVDLYRFIFEKADMVIYTAKTYTKGCMHRRNRHLVDISGHCIYYLEKKSGGTAYTVDYAQQNGLQLVSVMEESNETKSI